MSVYPAEITWDNKPIKPEYMMMTTDNWVLACAVINAAETLVDETITGEQLQQLRGEYPTVYDNLVSAVKRYHGGGKP